MKEITYYYNDEQNDEFSGITRKDVVIDENFVFVNKNIFWNIAAFIWHRILITPVAFFSRVFIFHQHVKGRKKLRGYKGQYIIYGNHTNIAGDGLLPPTYIFPRKPYFIVSPANIAAKGTKNLIMMLGGYPIPTTLRGLRPFEEGLKRHLAHHHPIVIYPEAHIWPYYTHIRDFKSTSFKYPIKFNVPAFSFVNTYQKRLFFKKPKMVTYIDGPFYPNKDLSGKEAEKELRDRVYNQMVIRSKENNIEYKYHYIKKEKQDV